MIEFKCPVCGANISVPDYLAGTKTFCSVCQQHVNIPAAKPAGTPPPNQMPPFQQPRPQQPFGGPPPFQQPRPQQPFGGPPPFQQPRPQQPFGGPPPPQYPHSPQYYPPQGPPPFFVPHPGMFQPPQGLAVASMVCGIVGLCLFCAWFVSIPLAIIAISMGGVAVSRNKQGTAGGMGMAQAGLITGVITIVLAILIIFISTLH